MNTSIITLQYNDQITVDFTKDAWFNATAVARNYNKRPNDWLNLESTKEYIWCLHHALFPEIELPEKMVIKQNQLLNTKTGSVENGGGSWIHPKLAIAFARWLDVRFAVWCDMQIDKLLKTVPNALRDLPRPNITGMEAAQLKKSVEAAYGIDSYMNLPAGKLNEALLFLGLKPVEMPKTVMITVEEYNALKSAKPEPKQGMLVDMPTLMLALPNDNNRVVVIRHNGVTSMFEMPENYLFGSPETLARDLKALGYIVVKKQEVIARLEA
jgi:hypothetical protein